MGNTGSQFLNYDFFQVLLTTICYKRRQRLHSASAVFLRAPEFLDCESVWNGKMYCLSEFLGWRRKSVTCHCVIVQSDGTMVSWQTLYSIENSVSHTASYRYSYR